MRLFVAVNFSGETKEKLFELREQIRVQASRGNFSRPENFHLTLAFLGETPEDKLRLLFRIMGEINSPPFEIIFNRIGSFTHSRKELWWIGADAERGGLPLLGAIHRQLLSRLDEEGFSVDKRPFNAHITLGREVKHSAPIVTETPEIVVRVDRISLMKSEHIGGILTYTELMGKPLIGRS